MALIVVAAAVVRGVAAVGSFGLEEAQFVGVFLQQMSYIHHVGVSHRLSPVDVDCLLLCSYQQCLAYSLD